MIELVHQLTDNMDYRYSDWTRVLLLGVTLLVTCVHVHAGLLESLGKYNSAWEHYINHMYHV